MNPAWCEDPIVRGVVCGMAREMANGRFEASDLASEAFVRILSAKEPPRVDRPRSYFKILSRWAMLAHIRAELRLSPRSNLSLEDCGEECGGLAKWDYPDPPEDLVGLFSSLTDLESHVVTLVCGLDGSPGRSPEAVAFMLGKDDSGIRKRLANALSKLRAKIEERSGVH